MNPSDTLTNQPGASVPAEASPSPEATQSPEESFADILSQFEQEHAEPRQGEALEGTVVQVTDEAVFVDIGRKMEGQVPLEKLQEAIGSNDVKAGDRIVVTVTGRDQEGYYMLSTLKVERPKDWSGLEAAFAEGRVVVGRVIEQVKGGLRVDVGARAFMPASRSGARDVPDMEKLIGQEVRCRITKLDTANEDVVVDRRVVLEEEARAAKDAAFGSLQEGAVLRGRVRTITEFGAFVDLGGVDGLLHVTDISWTRIGKPADVLKIGDDIDVKILKINRDTRKVSLGMKQLQPDPWTLASSQFEQGQRVKGTVARLADFGAFITLAPGVDGLVHVSELSWSKKVRKPSDVLKQGEQVEVVILSIHAGDRKISLGLKQALGDPWESVEAKFPIGAIIEAPVVNLANFGAFVDLGDGIEGMIHVGDITREKRLEHPKDKLKAGEVVKAQVLEIDREKRRIRLGMKQLEPTSTDHWMAEHQVGETVTARVAEVKGNRVRVELGDGVFGTCSLKQEESDKGGSSAAKSSGSPLKADLSSLTAQLAAKWKQGGGPSSDKPAQSGGGIRPGQVMTFKIASIDTAAKKIHLDIA